MQSAASRQPGSKKGCELALLAPLAAVGQGVGAAGTQVPAPNDRQFVSAAEDVRITAAVPSAAEAREIFGVPLYKRSVQPVWIRVENSSDSPLWFMPAGIDPFYFTPIEAANLALKGGRDRAGSIDEVFYSQRMQLRIAPGEVRSGYVFTHLDEGTKSFNVDLLGENGQRRATFFVPVPGLRVDHENVAWTDLYTADEIRDVNTAELVAGLEALPCCVTDKRGRNNGDPLNFALIGAGEDVYYALMRAGWDETETIYGSSLLKTAKSALAGSEYRYSPVSALYVFGRAQDAALQKTRASIHQRNHLRLWLTPMRYNGTTPVWIGQISRDIGVRLTKKTITTHKIDPDVDETREYLLEDLAYAQSIAAFGYVHGAGPAAYDAPRGNLTGDPYFTDGLRLVMFVSSQTTDITEIELLDLGARP